MPSFSGDLRGPQALQGKPSPSAWCDVCGTDHRRAEDCPGELRATGPEQPGSRIHVETPRSIEAIGVLVAPCRDLWRARILTFPNILWTVPGGGASLKFVGRTAEEAEGRALVFIREHCLDRGYPMRNQLAPVDAGAPASVGTCRISLPEDRSKRKPLAIPLWYGMDRPNHRGVTVNVSQDGMFVATPSPHELGSPLRIRMAVESGLAHLGGVVVWKRQRVESGRPAGMGLRLLDVPTLYSQFVRTLS